MRERWWERDDRVGRVTIPVAIAVVAAGVSVLTTEASPTGWAPADVLWIAGSAVSLSLLAARSAPWTWIVLAAGACAVADGPWIAVAVVALGVAVTGAFVDVPLDPTGAVVGGLAHVALLHAEVPGPVGTEMLVALALVTPVAVSGSTRIRSRTRTRIASASAIGLTVLISSSVAAAVVAVDSRDDVRRSIDLVELAADRARDGDELMAADHLAEARELLVDLDEGLTAPWLVPARATPVVGHHLNAAIELGRGGSEVAGSAAELLSAIDELDLALTAGGVDLAAIEALQPPTADVVAELDALGGALDDAASPWLVAPVAERLDDARSELDDGLGTLRDVEEFLALAPEVLGVSRPQRYLVLFGTTAETRGGGGFVGNFAVVTADGGRVAVTTIGRGENLNEDLPNGRADLDPELVSLYEPFGPELFIQNIAVSPDFATTAEAASSFYRQARGDAVDGVLLLDPSAMAALVELTGPVEVDGRRLRARAVQEFVLVDNYVRYDDDEDARLAALDELVLGVASRLTTLELPSPWELADVFGPIARRGGLRFWSPVEQIRSSTEALGFAGAFPEPNGGDLLAVVNRNMGGNKIDAFLERTLRYDVDVDPDSGLLVATLTIELTNTAPATGLPDAIIGNNDRGLPFGTNLSEVTVYGPSVLRRATLDGREVAMSTAEELGWLRHRYEVLIPPESTVTLEVELEGVVDIDTGYRLEVVPPALPIDDQLIVTVGPDEHWARAVGDGDGAQRGRTLSVEERLTLEFEREQGRADR